MLLRIDFAAMGQVRQHWRGIGVTLAINWLVKPSSMALLGWIFLRLVFAPWLPAGQVDSYIAGLILLNGISDWVSYDAFSPILVLLAGGTFIGAAPAPGSSP